MGWQDREYGSELYGEYGAVERRSRRPPAATLALMIVHGVAWLVMLMLSSERGGVEVPLPAPVDIGQHPAGILLHPIATRNLFSAAFAVLAIWWLGGRLERRFGAARVLWLYFGGNLVAGVVFWLLSRTVPGAADLVPDYPAGALAAMCLAVYRTMGSEPTLVFGRTTTLGKVLAICVAIALGLRILGKGLGAVGWVLSVLVGALIGLWVERLPRLRARKARRGARRSGRRSPRPAPEPDIDDILAKISASGFDSLTDDEKARLEAARRAKLRGR